MLKKLKLDTFSFVVYKFFNSLFLGVSIGSIFTIYEDLDPSLFSAGGIFLAIATLIIAKFYNKILNENYFFKISLFVELIVFFMVLGFLLFSYNIYKIFSPLRAARRFISSRGAQAMVALAFVFFDFSLLFKLHTRTWCAYDNALCA